MKDKAVVEQRNKLHRHQVVMKIRLLVFILLLTPTVFGQNEPVPYGESQFIRTLGGLSFEYAETTFFDKLTAGKIDKIEGGGGVGEWSVVGNRIFLTRRWMIEIGEVKEGFAELSLERKLATDMRRQMKEAGFKLNPESYPLVPIRYQKGTTVGSVEMFSFFLGDGNVPLRLEFIFYESYLRKPLRRSKQKVIRGAMTHINDGPPKPIRPPDITKPVQP